MRNFLLLSILFGFFAAAPAWAQGTGQQRTACTDDAYRFCEAQIPVAEDVAACLRAHMSALSPACRRELTRPGGRKAKRRGRRRY
jgi:hypothetical protein